MTESDYVSETVSESMRVREWVGNVEGAQRLREKGLESEKALKSKFHNGWKYRVIDMPTEYTTYVGKYKQS